VNTDLMALVEAWDPAGSRDLPDEVAVALDADPAFRAWFDARFTRWIPPVEADLPAGLAERVLPPDEETLANQPRMASLGTVASPARPANRRWIWGMAGMGALAAAALAIVVTAGVGGGALWMAGPREDALLPPTVHGDAPVSPEPTAGPVRVPLASLDEHDARAAHTKGARPQVKEEAQNVTGLLAAAPGPVPTAPPPVDVKPEQREVTKALLKDSVPGVGYGDAGGGLGASSGTIGRDSPSRNGLDNIPTGRSYQTTVQTVGGVADPTRASEGQARAAAQDAAKERANQAFRRSQDKAESEPDAPDAVADGLGDLDVDGAKWSAAATNENTYALDGVKLTDQSRGDGRKTANKSKPKEAHEDLDLGNDGGGGEEEDAAYSSMSVQKHAPKTEHLQKTPPSPKKPSAKSTVAEPVPVAMAVPREVPAVVGVQPQMSENLSSTRADYPGFVRTAQDALSTFSIDVDTASYTQIRRTLNEGYLPPTDSVRLEEMINYFPYDYPAPPAGEPFSVAVEGAPAPWGATDLVRIGVQGKKVTTRQACHLTFLVDVSGSMSGPDRLGLVQQSLKMLVQGLGDGDTVSLVVYAGSSGVVLEPTALRNKDQIDAAIDRLQAGGSTAMGEGISLAYKMADESYVRGATNRVIIASDGDANVGVTDTAALSEMISRYAHKGITLTTLGFGSGNYRDTRMEQLANDGDGNYFYIDSQKEAKRVLVDKLTGTLEVIAKDVKLQVDWNPKTVRKYRLLGYENRDIADKDFRVDAVDAGEIGAGHQVTAIYEVERIPAAQGDLFTLRVRSKAPGPDSPAVERRFSGSAESMRASIDQTSKDFRVALGAAMFGERLRGSPYAPGYSYADIERLVVGAHHGPEDAELAGLVERARKLTSEGTPSCRDVAYEDDSGQLVRRRIDRNGDLCK
jgi:Ca-activated chloride channel family protein